jgi:hypothetical protein
MLNKSEPFWLLLYLDPLCHKRYITFIDIQIMVFWIVTLQYCKWILKFRRT